MSGNICLGAQPAAAHSVDEGGADVLSQIFCIDTTGGHKANAHESSGNGLHGFETAVDIGGEELNDLHAVGGSWVCPKADIAAGNWEKITELCIEARKNAKGE